MANSINEILRKATTDYLAAMNRNAPPLPSVTEQDLLTNMKHDIQSENAIRTQAHEPKLKVPDKLAPVQIAEIVAYFYPIYCIRTGGEGSDRSYDLLALYQSQGPNEGIYVTDDETIRALLRQYNYTITSHEVTECITVLREIVPRKERCHDRNLIAVNNGIFDYDTKTLLPFTPDLVFMSKSRVNYIQNPTNPIIHNDEDGTDWDVESWMKELSDDPEVVNLLWEVLGAIIRPLVPWNKSAWFYSETGNNGKGTLCELMRQLCGEGSYASIPLADMGKDFALEPLTRASAIIVDENDVGTFIDKAANVKAIITNDVLPINRKFKTPIAFKFYGFMVQCLNEMPKVKDKSDSFFRRQLFIPFTKCFTGIERKYIKADYLHRSDVLEYVLHRVLHMDYYALSEPDACKKALAEYRDYNDPVRQFLDDILSEVKWDFLPFTLLYQMYQAWFNQYVPSGKIQSRNTFINDIVQALMKNTQWECRDKTKAVRMSKMMTACEPLLEKYNLKDWMNPKYANKFTASMEDKCTPAPGQYNSLRYRGINRRFATTNPNQPLWIEDDETENDG